MNKNIFLQLEDMTATKTQFLVCSWFSGKSKKRQNFCKASKRYWKIFQLTKQNHSLRKAQNLNLLLIALLASTIIIYNFIGSFFPHSFHWACKKKWTRWAKSLKHYLIYKHIYSRHCYKIPSQRYQNTGIQSAVATSCVKCSHNQRHEWRWFIIIFLYFVVIIYTIILTND